MASAAQSPTPPVGGKGRQFFSLRKYTLQQGAGLKLTESFVGDALIPALNRMGITPVGAFRLTVGPETPTLYLLLPSSTLDSLVTADLRLLDDAAFMSAAAPFWNAPAGQPPFLRCESSLSIAFEGFPNLVPPAKGKRIFQLRTYESPTYAAHVRKVEMFHKGEFDIFKNAGCAAVFYSDNLIGKRLPSLTYMLTFPDQAALDAGWARFVADPEWKKLQANPRYTDQIVNSIDNLILTPAPYSQI
jgi:hypothetical protein